MTKPYLLLYWTLRLLAAIIMLQTLYFKFSGSQESDYIFKTIGIEPWGRIAIGVLELIASLMLRYRITVWLGALLGVILMTGAIVMHLTVLGIEVKNDGGYLFILAITVAIACITILIFNRSKIFSLIDRFKKETV